MTGLGFDQSMITGKMVPHHRAFHAVFIRRWKMPGRGNAAFKRVMATCIISAKIVVVPGSQYFVPFFRR